jgi:hypothetical protein
VFSKLPRLLGQFDVRLAEFTYHVYLPIKMADAGGLRVPAHLYPLSPLIEHAMVSCSHDGRYVYLTVKKMYIAKNQSANRPGWHLDGYGTDDDNFIWSDCLPTEFVTGEFNLSADHQESLAEMRQQAEGRAIHVFPERTMIWLDPTNVHRVVECNADCVRTFVKISISRHRYNLAGNAHNYLFDYDWPMVERIDGRNHPIAEAV